MQHLVLTGNKSKRQEKIWSAVTKQKINSKKMTKVSLDIIQIDQQNEFLINFTIPSSSPLSFFSPSPSKIHYAKLIDSSLRPHSHMCLSLKRYFRLFILPSSNMCCSLSQHLSKFISHITSCELFFLCLPHPPISLTVQLRGDKIAKSYGIWMFDTFCCSFGTVNPCPWLLLVSRWRRKNFGQTNV